MAPLIPSAKATLAYPLFACEFDPLDSSRLFVGGGGGAGRSGVPNRITLFDTSKAEELVETGEIELSKDEDSVTSIAVGQKDGNSTLVYAGVNSSPKNISEGKNKHFRVFKVDRNTKGEGKSVHKIAESSRTTIFTGVEKDLYQRVTRLSKPYEGQSQIGAVTTGLAKQSEVILFDNTGKSPKIIGGWQSDKEAADCDFIHTGENEYQFGYSDEHDVWLTKISKGKVSTDEPTCIYVTPASDDFEKPKVPSIKSLRWLTKDYLALLSNINGGNGVVVQILRLSPSGTGHAAVVKSVRLPSSVSKATGFAVANLTPPHKPTDTQGYTQFVIGVAGHDISISLFKVDLQAAGPANLITSIKPFKTFKSVHPIQITSLALSNFSPPTHPVTAQTPPQYLKLASTSMSNTVVVHTLPLFPVPLSVKRGQSKTPRYVVALPSTNFAFGGAMILSVIFIALASIFVEAIIDIRGGPPSRLGTTKYVPIQWQRALGKPYEFPTGYSASLNTPAPTSAYGAELETETATVVPIPAHEADSAGLNLQDLVEQAQAAGSDGVVIIKDTPGEEGVKAHLHDEEAHGTPPAASKWEDLSAKQKEGWKRRLSELGHWAEEMPETLFKGVLFSELAGAVGRAVVGG